MNVFVPALSHRAVLFGRKRKVGEKKMCPIPAGPSDGIVKVFFTW